MLASFSKFGFISLHTIPCEVIDTNSHSIRESSMSRMLCTSLRARRHLGNCIHGRHCSIMFCCICVYLSRRPNLHAN
uniref:Uncharacterized protein n=1 Tax=Lotus japonicus TaxID=34305 RepID=I3T9Z8_LOTJA|nr:unknown [Lotus japonicus]